MFRYALLLFSLIYETQFETRFLYPFTKRVLEDDRFDHFVGLKEMRVKSELVNRDRVDF